MERITQEHLDGVCNRLNRITNNPLEYMTDGNINVGHYHIDYAYGGARLVQTVNDGGGVKNPCYMGYVSKRECYHQILAYIYGVESMIMQDGDKSGQ